MAGFLKRLFGRGSQTPQPTAPPAAPPTPAGAASAAAPSMPTMAPPAAPAPSAPTAPPAAAAPAAPPSAAPGAADAAAGTVEATTGAGGLLDAAEGLLPQASELTGGGLPDLGKIEEAINGLSQPELQGATNDALSKVPSDFLGQLGGLVSQFLNQSGQASAAQNPAGVAAGNPGDLAQTISTLLKGQGLTALTGIFGGSEPGAGATGGGGGIDVAGLLSNPLARQIITALLPAIAKAFSGKQS